jgi:hypothetical protein
VGDIFRSKEQHSAEHATDAGNDSGVANTWSANTWSADAWNADAWNADAWSVDTWSAK